MRHRVHCLGQLSRDGRQEFAIRARADGSQLEFYVYPGAGHNYDDPGQKKHSVPANRRATEDTFRRAEAFFALHLR